MNAKCCGAAIAAVVTILVVWGLGAFGICSNCYRLGNYLDYYFQERILRELHAAGDEQAVAWIGGPHSLAHGIWRGVRLRRLFWLRWRRPLSLIELFHDRRTQLLTAFPTPSRWSRPDAAALRQALVAGAMHSSRTRRPEFFLWWNQAHVQMLLPYLRDTIRSAVAPPAIADERRTRTCVVHFRVGDFTREMSGGWKREQLLMSIAVMVAAASTFAMPIDRFEVLGGGLDHNCNPAKDDCGASALRLMLTALQSTFQNASVVRVRGQGVDRDFRRMVNAPMLLLGTVGTQLKVGSSFAVYAAAASRGEVRSPACFLRFDRCFSHMKSSRSWHGYAHPHCKHCRDLRARPTDWERIVRVKRMMANASTAAKHAAKRRSTRITTRPGQPLKPSSARATVPATVYM